MTYHKSIEKLRSGSILVLDGGTGTELEKRGVPMDPGAWCGIASLDNADILEKNPYGLLGRRCRYYYYQHV